MNRDAVAVVTGGGRSVVAHGVGSASSVALARKGFRIAVIDVDGDAAARTVAEIESDGGAAFAVVADLGTVGGCESAVQQTTARGGRIEVLVNNLAIVQPGSALEITDEQWVRTITLNLTSTFRMSRLVLPPMIEHQSGSIINIGSIAGLRGGGNTVAYAASKAGLLGLTQDMAASHGRDGVRVNLVAPGYLYTPMVASAGIAGNDEVREARKRLGVLTTEGTCWDVAGAVSFLSGDESRWITGAVIPVDAGAQLQQPLAVANRFAVMPSG